MEKESLAQSATWDRAATSVVIDGIAIDPEERRDIFGAHYFCVHDSRDNRSSLASNRH